MKIYQKYFKEETDADRWYLTNIKFEFCLY
jgi:hypothetical protein